MAGGKFAGGLQVATLANGEIGIAPFHNFDAQVPQALKDGLAQATKDIIDGKIKVNSFSTLGEAAQMMEGGKVCEVTDTGGVDDKSFNQTAWTGAQTIAEELNWEATYLESQQQTDYEKNINEFINSDCNLIVTVGFLLGDATLAAAVLDRLAANSIHIDIDGPSYRQHLARQRASAHGLELPEQAAS